MVVLPFVPVTPMTLSFVSGVAVERGGDIGHRGSRIGDANKRGRAGR